MDDDRTLLERAARAAGLPVPVQGAYEGCDDRGFWWDTSLGGDGTTLRRCEAAAVERVRGVLRELVEAARAARAASFLAADAADDRLHSLIEAAARAELPARALAAMELPR